MDNKYFWLALAAVCGGAVYQVKKNEPLSIWRRMFHLAAGAAVAVYASPVIISYYELSKSEWQYLVPFVVGMFWLKLFEAADASIGSIRLPWSK